MRVQHSNATLIPYAHALPSTTGAGQGAGAWRPPHPADDGIQWDWWRWRGQWRWGQPV